MIDLKEELNVYIDDDTGDEYVWDGSKLILIKKGSKGNFGDKGDDWQGRAAEEAERNKEAAENGTLETAEELNNRVQRIKDALNDPDYGKKLKDEAGAARQRDVQKRELRDLEKKAKIFNSNPIIQFEGNLNSFLKKQMKMMSEPSYAKFNKKYDGTGLIRKGDRKRESPEVPYVQVYFDRSRSWDEEKTKVGRDALATLNKYVRLGKLKLVVSYFNSVVFDDYIEDGTDGTYGSPILADVQAKQPDNVIVMTDADITDCQEHVEVPGKVWYLFSGGVSDNIRSHLTGKMGTESYEIRPRDVELLNYAKGEE